MIMLIVYDWCVVLLGMNAVPHVTTISIPVLGPGAVGQLNATNVTPITAGTHKINTHPHTTTTSQVSDVYLFQCSGAFQCIYLFEEFIVLHTTSDV